MKFRIVVQGVPDEPEIQHFDTPIEAEAAYFRLSSIRTDGALPEENSHASHSHFK